VTAPLRQRHVIFTVFRKYEKRNTLDENSLAPKTADPSLPFFPLKLNRNEEEIPGLESRPLEYPIEEILVLYRRY